MVASHQRSGHNGGNTEGEEEGLHENPSLESPQDHAKPPLELRWSVRQRFILFNFLGQKPFERGAQQQHLEAQMKREWPLHQSCSCHAGLGSSAEEDAR